MKEGISIWTHDWNFLERPNRSIDIVQSSSLPLKQITAILKIVILDTLIYTNSFQVWNNSGTTKFLSFQLILSASKLVVSYQSLYLLNFVVITNFIPFFNWQTISFSWASANKFQRGYCVIIICFQEQSATTLFASKHDHRMSLSIRFVIARCKSQSNCYFNFLPAISLSCPLFHFFARYFNKNSKTSSQSDLRNNA